MLLTSMEFFRLGDLGDKAVSKLESFHLQGMPLRWEGSNKDSWLEE